ncbi:MAG: hypothetical protein IPK34_14565 [Ramlibacter sp.]|nr:hypothetical protein [Ramlibacter sp.]
MPAQPQPRSLPDTWLWPHSAPGHVALRLADQHFIQVLERGPAALHQAVQRQALQRLLAHARQSSPWWRDWLAGSQLHILARLPVLQREQLRASVADAGGPLPMPPAHGGARKGLTSGSSGVPVDFYVSALAQRVSDSHYLADHARHGRDLRRLFAGLLTRFAPHPGQPHQVITGDRWLGMGPMVGRNSQQGTIREHAQWLHDTGPAYLNTAPSVLRGMLDEIESGAVSPPAGLEQVLTIGETVDDVLRQRTRALTGASIRDRYTCEEIGPVALQCPHDASETPAYHVCVGNAVVETVDESDSPCTPGQAGRVLVTGLHHWATPVIRYDIGDIAALHPRCPACGAQVPSLTQLLGRKRFLVRLPSGERKYLKLTGKDWLSILPVREHRLVQDSPSHMLVELVVERPLTASDHETAQAMLARVVDPSFTFEIRQVDRIAWGPGIKRQDVLSLV